MKGQNLEDGYILDFDGVICDSNLEVYATSLMAYLDMINARIDDSRILEDRIFFSLFIEHRNIGRISSDFYELWLTAFREGGIKEYLPKNEKVTVEIKRRYRKAFFSTRDKRKKAGMDSWLSDSVIYPHVKVALSKALGSRAIYIASAKDEDSIYQILKFNNLEIDRSKIFGSQKYADKEDMYKAILDSAEHQKWKYIEDNIINAQKGIEFGFECYYATWGYGDDEFSKDKCIVNITPGNLYQFFDL